MYRRRSRNGGGGGGGGGGGMIIRQILSVVVLLIITVIVVFAGAVHGALDPVDARIMRELAQNIDAANSLGWDSSEDPCRWKGVACGPGLHVLGIDFQSKGVNGSLPAEFNQLSQLSSLSIQHNLLSGALPSFAGMANLQAAFVNGNRFSSVPPGFFKGLTSLQVFAMDSNPFSAWNVPDDLLDSANLVNFSASNAGLVGPIPSFFGQLANLYTLSLSMNSLSGPIPQSFAGSNMAVLWLNSQKGQMLSGGTDVLAKMTNLVQVFLFSNAFTGPIPDLSGLKSLKEIKLSFNRFTGPVPQSLINLPSLKAIALTANALQGSFPEFPSSVDVEIDGSSNSFCLSTPVPCDPRVTVFLAFTQNFGYPYGLASAWKGNNPCGWRYISCNANGDVTVLNLANMNLSGTISPALGNLTQLSQIILSNNNISGAIPPQIASLPNLRKLDLRNNNLQLPLPQFRDSVTVLLDGNPSLSHSGSPDTPAHASPPPNSDPATAAKPGNSSSSSPNSGAQPKKNSPPPPHLVVQKPTGIIAGTVGALVGMGMLGMVFLFLMKQKSRAKKKLLLSEANAGDGGLDSKKATDAVGPLKSYPKYSTDPRLRGRPSYSPSTSSCDTTQDCYDDDEEKLHLTVPILRHSTDDFNEANILGRGGFGVVYKGKLATGKLIAVKRMEVGIVIEKGLNEFKAEISVLSKVRHRHLVSLLGHCMDGKERLLVYEYVSQGPLSHHLFEWKRRHLKPVSWTQRLVIALDVAKGVEYLHALARQSFIHRDLKPSNILLTDDLRAKVSDFGLVRLAPDNKASVETKLAGTFGYLAPEYAVTGRVTTKADVFSFGVILMEMITGRKALDDSQPEENRHLVSWFRKQHSNRDKLRSCVDPSMELTDEIFRSICTVAELAGHCTAREPYQRADMSHAVNVLSTMVEVWKPCEANDDEEEDNNNNDNSIGIGLDLKEALKRWQSLESTKSANSIDTHSVISVTSRPVGFAESFTSSDGR